MRLDACKRFAIALSNGGVTNRSMGLADEDGVSMRTHEIEAWALRVIDRVKAKHPFEDSRVELKSEWLPPPKVARLIAAHANAARGEPILWLIGVDEERGIIGISRANFANWWVAVRAQFDELPPNMIDLDVPVEGVNVVVLLFGTDRAPFVVKNPAFNTPQGGPVSLEVPWREGTSTRSARRSDLVRILSPMAALPTVRVRSGRLILHKFVRTHRADSFRWTLRLSLYLTPSSSDRIIIPFHLCKASVEILGSSDKREFEGIKLSPPIGFEPLSESPPRSKSVNLSETVLGSSSELIVNGPGTCHLDAEVVDEEPSSVGPDSEALVRISLQPARSNSNVSLEALLIPDTTTPSHVSNVQFQWRFKAETY